MLVLLQSASGGIEVGEGRELETQQALQEYYRMVDNIGKKRTDQWKAIV